MNSLNLDLNEQQIFELCQVFWSHYFDWTTASNDYTVCVKMSESPLLTVPTSFVKKSILL